MFEIMNKEIIEQCKRLLNAYKEWQLWYTTMPEDANPWFLPSEKELCLCYFTLPMALNYQRNSYALRESVLQSYNDPETKDIFDIKKSSTMPEEALRTKLTKHKVALQPHKHIQTRKTIAKTTADNRGSIEHLFLSTNYDFLQLKHLMQKEHKIGFPYLSWPKIFNYRSWIIQQYWWITLKNSEYIDIAPDTHITKCSIRLWIITQEESETLTKEKLSEKRRTILQWTWVNPIDMHAPLRFRSRNNFIFEL